MRPNLAVFAAKQHGSFTWRQARFEYTSSEIQTLLRNGAWVRVFRGVYRDSATPMCAPLAVEAARLSMDADAAIACYMTAAQLHGFAVIDDPVTHVLSYDSRTTRRGRLYVHRDWVTPETVTTVDDTMTTRPGRTAVDLARTLRRLDAIATLDVALRRGVSRDVLRDEAVRHWTKRGIRQARELIALADARAESPMESRTRLRCIDADLPRPVPQFEVWAGRMRYRLDLAWPEARIGLEYESTEWHTGAAAMSRDNPRHNALTNLGWTMFYATADEVYRRPEAFTSPIRRALASA
jgi:hypothetical protein